MVMSMSFELEYSDAGVFVSDIHCIDIRMN